MATQAKVIIKGENNLTRAVKSASSDLSGLKGAADKLGSTIKGAFTVTAIIAGVKALGNAVKQCIDTWAVQEQAYVSLDAVMNNIGKSTGMTTKELTDIASSLQSVTKFGDEAIIPAEQILVATGKLNNENLPHAIELSLDMATALGTDAAGGAQKLAMALQDPATGLRTLRQANITFSASEKETINSLLASGKTFDAQSLILDKVANAYGGLAQKVAATPTGKITQINNLLGDVKEGLGEGIVMALEPAFDWLVARLSEVCRIINDLNTDTKLRADFEVGGASLVGTKYSPDTIVSSMGKLNDEMKIYENQLMDLLTADQPWSQRKSYRNTKASQDLRTMGASGWMAWDQMPEHSGSESGYQAYLQWKGLSDMLTRMGSALTLSQNYDAKSGVDAFQGNTAVDDASDEETLVSTLVG
ncbi:MAG: phage tail length tape measure family protein [Sphaerochaetaceae bacterium]